MFITIKIDCETIAEFHSHLTELRRQIKKKTKKLNLQPDDEFQSGVDLDDNNCYGTHDTTIKQN